MHASAETHPFDGVRWSASIDA